MKKLKRVLVFLCFFFISFWIADSKETSSYYSEKNAPEFYGMTKAIVQKDSKFDLSLAYLRIFAKDFEDGDLTDKIKIVSNNVDTSKVGNYEIVYSVTDSHNNETSITVPIEVVDNDEGNYYERTLYSLPSVPDGNITGPRGKYMDRQITGFMLEEGTTINIKKISGPDLTANIYSDSASYASSTINSTGVDITASKVSTVFFMTPYDASETTVVGITIKDEDVIGMPYYHYKDDEEAFRQYWASLQENGTTVGLIEGYSIAYYLLPIDSPEKFKSFGTIDAGLEFFDKLTNEYDELLGYEYDADKPWNQNVKMRYFVTGGGADNGLYAYFTNNQVVLAGSSTPSNNGFCIGWAIMHEIGHGYQGAALKEDSGMGLLEVSGNILAYYAQNKSDFQDEISGNWLGEISNKEVSVNNARLNGKTFRQLDSGSKLYVLVNLLDTYDYKNDYAYLASMSRKLYYEGKISNYSLADRYVLAYHELYGVNISSYFEAWGETVSQDVKELVKDDKSLVMLSDAVNDSTLTGTIQSDLGLEGKYSLVEQEKLDKYSIKANVKIKLNIDDISNLIGKKITLTDGTNTYTKEVTSNEIDFEVNIGSYQLAVPVPRVNYYIYDAYVTVNAVNGKDNEYTITYTKNNTDMLSLDTQIYLSGQGKFANITFDSENIIITTTGDATHWYWSTNDNYAYVKIYDELGNQVFEKEYKGSTWTTAAVEKVAYKTGYKIEIFHDEGSGDDRINIIHKFTGTKVADLTHIKGVNNYMIGEYGLYQLNDDDTYDSEADYNNYKAVIDEYAKKLLDDLSDDELANKNLKTSEKSVLLSSIYKLNEEDKDKYLEKYRNIYNGSSPVLTTNELTFNEGDTFKILDLLKATDIEDGDITLTKDNFSYKTNIPLSDENIILSSGQYSLDYTILDSDFNKKAGTISIIVKEKIKDDTNASDKSDTNVSDNNASDKDKTDTNVSDNNASDKDKTDTNISDNNVSDKDKADTNKTETSANESNKVTSNATSNKNTNTSKTNQNTSSSNQTNASVSTNEEINNTDVTTNDTVNEDVTSTKDEVIEDNSKVSDASANDKETSKNVIEEKHKLNIIDKWLDDEITPFEICACISLTFAMALILAYLNRIF